MIAPSDDGARDACARCRYWRRLEANPSQGECRRRAPRPVTDGGVHSVATWPVTDPDDWCGEFRDRAAPMA
jgi:hypothetical protein